MRDTTGATRRFFGRVFLSSQTPSPELGCFLQAGQLGPPVVPFLTLFWGEGSPTKIDYRKSWYQLILSSLEDLVAHASQRVPLEALRLSSISCGQRQVHRKFRFMGCSVIRCHMPSTLEEHAGVSEAAVSLADFDSYPLNFVPTLRTAWFESSRVASCFCQAAKVFDLPKGLCKSHCARRPGELDLVNALHEQIGIHLSKLR